VVTEEEGAEVGLIAYGSTHWAVLEARDELRAAGVPSGYLLLRALPFDEQLERFVRKHRRVYVVEQNRDGQMADLIRLEVRELAPRVNSVRHFTGLPIDARFVTEAVMAGEGRPLPAAAAVAAGVAR
jgi:2-oxoglutarate ferredoxin oxidoreductase subunit alpha